MAEIVDKYNLVYLMFLAQGVGTLMPWNMFITANDYFVNYKLSANYTNQDTSAYSQLFLQYLGVISNTPLVFFTWLNLFVKVQAGTNLGPRILISIAIEAVLFLLTIILAMVDSSGWPGAFFAITMLTACLLNCIMPVNAVYQNSIFGIAAEFPPKYTGGIILGNNISGVLTSLILIISDAVTSSKSTAAKYYFITAILVLMTCFDVYLSFIINKYYRYTHFKAKKEAIQAQKTDETNAGKVPYWEIFKKAAPQLFNVFFVFTVTLWNFPAIMANVKRYSKSFPISEKYFTSVTCFLTFNLFAMLGSLLPLLIIWPGPKTLWIPVTLRGLFFPFFILCNYQVLDKKRKLPVLIGNDWIYWLGAAAMSFTSGYFSSIGMMYAPGTVEPQHAPIAGMLAGASLVTGVFAGIILSFMGPLLI